MNHFERLILRALATPRHRRPGVFDPFEQVAEWPLDPLETAPAAPPAATPLMSAREHPAPPGTPVPEARATAPALAPEPVLPGSRPAPVLPASPPQAPGATVQVLAAPTSPAQHAATAPPVPTAHAQAHADAFMRAMGIQGIPAAPVTPAPPRTLAPGVGVAPRSVAVAPTGAAPGAAALVQPPEPAPRADAPARRAAPPSPSPYGPATAEPAPSPRASRQPVPQERVVATTVVVSAGGRPLDDLAHASRIVRFGIGQG